MHADAEYYRMRLDQERHLAKAETNVSVRQVHEKLAKIYQSRLRADYPKDESPLDPKAPPAIAGRPSLSHIAGPVYLR